MNLPDRKSAVRADREACEQPILTIEIFFDFIGPWCLIGKRNLDNGEYALSGGYPPELIIDAMKLAVRD